MLQEEVNYMTEIIVGTLKKYEHLLPYGKDFVMVDHCNNCNREVLVKLRDHIKRKDFPLVQIWCHECIVHK